MGGGSSSSGPSATELRLQKQQLALQAKGQALDAYDRILGMEGQIDQYGLDIRDLSSQISGYDQWLANYGNLQAMEEQSTALERERFQAAGIESFENFKNAIGMQDSSAAMTGRVGAGTSAAAVAARVDRDLVAFAGADRSLAGSDGVYGMQASLLGQQAAQRMSDLQDQRASMEGNKGIARESLAMTESAITTAQKNLNTARGSYAELAEFADRTWAAATAVPPSFKGAVGLALNKK
jgi:hypothetical protein